MLKEERGHLVTDSRRPAARRAGRIVLSTAGIALAVTAAGCSGTASTPAGLTSHYSLSDSQDLTIKVDSTVEWEGKVVKQTLAISVKPSQRALRNSSRIPVAIWIQPQGPALPAHNPNLVKPVATTRDAGNGELIARFSFSHYTPSTSTPDGSHSAFVVKMANNSFYEIPVSRSPDNPSGLRLGNVTPRDCPVLC